ncbi:LOW QUALITY PROTEIN: hypothetical protein T265_14209 [Opisthorchis viverrini]|uniref:Uncharacterized protein n=1 Tax=Opisthorchis viverrini TaxID=6198 RepID=A0A074ZE75_OPIVI|nr:LOW QUALITY PROTEIN: hypothetical protein T265_14209 [Opisthorchis viverrini]KER25473.1 LOW QUALITY PROTEIN: hypothetical protein T265_14209 [Opisthorchis viverrini]
MVAWNLRISVYYKCIIVDDDGHFNFLNTAEAIARWLKWLGQRDSIPALVLPSGGIKARHRKGDTAKRITVHHMAVDLFAELGNWLANVSSPVEEISSLNGFHNGIGPIQLCTDDVPSNEKTKRLQANCQARRTDQLLSDQPPVTKIPTTKHAVVPNRPSIEHNGSAKTGSCECPQFFYFTHFSLPLHSPHSTNDTIRANQSLRIDDFVHLVSVLVVIPARHLAAIDTVELWQFFEDSGSTCFLPTCEGLNGSELSGVHAPLCDRNQVVCPRRNGSLELWLSTGAGSTVDL